MQFEHENVAWCLTLSHDEVVALRLGSLLVPAPAQPAVQTMLVIIEFADLVGGHNGVQVTGVVGIAGAAVAPRGWNLYGILRQLTGPLTAGLREIGSVIFRAVERISLGDVVIAGLPVIGPVILLSRLFGDNAGRMKASADAIGESETFHLFSLGEDRVALLSHRGFVCAENSGGGGVVADRHHILGWETFSIVRHGGNKVSFRCPDGTHFLCADVNENGRVVADRTRIGGWEQFLMEPQQNGGFALKSWEGQGQYVSVS